MSQLTRSIGPGPWFVQFTLSVSPSTSQPRRRNSSTTSARIFIAGARKRISSMLIVSVMNSDLNETLEALSLKWSRNGSPVTGRPLPVLETQRTDPTIRNRTMNSQNGQFRIKCQRIASCIRASLASCDRTNQMASDRKRLQASSIRPIKVSFRAPYGPQQLRTGYPQRPGFESDCGISTLHRYKEWRILTNSVVLLWIGPFPRGGLLQQAQHDLPF